MTGESGAGTHPTGGAGTGPSRVMAGWTCAWCGYEIAKMPCPNLNCPSRR